MNKVDCVKGNSYPHGVSIVSDGVQFCYTGTNLSDSVFLKIYKNNNVVYEVLMNDYCIAGCVYSVIISNINISDISYKYFVNGVEKTDKYCKSLKRTAKFGEKSHIFNDDIQCVYDDNYDWKGDSTLNLQFSEIISYMLHVRGFTRHSSSGVKGKGTFLGIVEKIPYFNELGINQIVIMPAYDFDEYDYSKSYRNEPVGNENDLITKKINYWGFKEGRYFVPNPAYAYSSDSVTEFKDMVRQLHNANIEVVMQFCFPMGINKNVISECLCYWVSEYHIDGLYIIGEDIQTELISTNPVLLNTKLYFERIDTSFYKGLNDVCLNENIAQLNLDYMTDVRRFIKSDEDTVNNFLFRQRSNSSVMHTFNCLSLFNTLTLYDSVAYDYKHNEANGEDNRDGSLYNFSWNCGYEGRTRKPAVNMLRLKQLKNAFTILMTSHATPLFMAGDEFMNSQDGNNNPYCIDNETTWLNWKKNKGSQELFDFVKKVIYLRKNNEVFHPKYEASMIDKTGCGYPDISYHGEMAWYPKLDNYIRHIGIMLCKDDGSEKSIYYVAYNMFWEPRKFALPRLPKNYEWSECINTSNDKCDNSVLNEYFDVDGRTVVVLKGQKKNISSEKNVKIITEDKIND